MYAYACTYVYLYACTYVYVCMHACMYIYLNVYARVYVSVCLYFCGEMFRIAASLTCGIQSRTLTSYNLYEHFFIAKRHEKSADRIRFLSRKPITRIDIKEISSTCSLSPSKPFKFRLGGSCRKIALKAINRRGSMLHRRRKQNNKRNAILLRIIIR